MSRIVLGPKLAAFSIPRSTLDTLASGAVPTSPKLDPTPNLVTMRTETDPPAIDFDVAAYDLATANKLTAITVVFVPSGHGEPTTAEDWMASNYPRGEADTSTIQSGGPVTVTVPGLDAWLQANNPALVAASERIDFGGQVLFTYDE